MDDFLAGYIELVTWMRSYILAESNPETLLKLATFYGTVRWSNADGVYSDDEIEQHVVERVLAANAFAMEATPTGNDDTVLIASELYDSGGHSRIVRNWLKCFHADGNHRLVVTRSIAKRFEDSLNANGYRFHLCTTGGVNLVREIIRSCGDARRIVLHTHPDDIISVTAARILARGGREILFFNHADHIFSYGVSFANRVCEVSSYGIALNHRTNRTARSCYLGIPIDIVSAASEAPKGAPIVLSCGASYKYRPAETFFGDFIDRLLIERPDAVVVLIGPVGNEPWWQNRKPRWGDRVRFMGELPHGEYLKVVASAAVYVDSFPIPGGTAFPENLLHGKQIVGLQNPLQGYSPVDELRVNSIEALARRTADLLAGDTVASIEIGAVRRKALVAHSLQEFRNRVVAIYDGKRTLCPWDVPVDTEWIERTWRAARTVNEIESARLFDLPLTFCFGFLSRISRFRKPAFLANRLGLRLLPTQFRNRLIAIREAALTAAAQQIPAETPSHTDREAA